MKIVFSQPLPCKKIAVKFVIFFSTNISFNFSHLWLFFLIQKNKNLWGFLFFIFKASVLWADAFYELICPSVRPSVCVSVRVFTFEVSFKLLFAPTSWSQLSNIFRDSESLEKSSEKKWSQIWTFLFGSGLKSPKTKQVFLADFALHNMVETTLPDEFETSGRRAYR